MKISIIGNKRVLDNTPDNSEAIDTSDLVVRVSKMDSIDSGKIGSRCDILVLEPNRPWERSPNKHLAKARQVPQIIIRPSWYDRQHDKLVKDYGFRTEQLIRLDDDFCDAHRKWLTAGLAIAIINANYPKATLHTYCIDIDNREAYIAKNPMHWPSTEASTLIALKQSGKLIDNT